MPKGRYGKNLRDDPTFNDNLSDPSVNEKVTLKNVHKNINALSGQLEKNQLSQNKQLKGISNSVSSTAKQQQILMKKIKMKELSGPEQVKAVEKSMHQVLGKLGYAVEAVGRNATKMVVSTARATKQHIAEYGRALSNDFAINKSNFVAMALSKASPIYGYFAGKFMETTVFKHFTSVIKEKLTIVVTYVANKIKDFWGRSVGAMREWFRDPKKWKTLYKATGRVLKFPFEKFGQMLAYGMKGLKFLAKLPFKALGAAFKLITKSLGFLLKLPLLMAKGIGGLIKLPFKLIGGAFGAVKSGYKSVGRKDQEKSRKKYEEMYGKPGEMPKLQQGGYVTKAGAVEIHAAEVVTPYQKLKDAFKRALIPAQGAITKELRGLRYALVGMSEDISAEFKMSLMKNPLFRSVYGIFSVMQSAFRVKRFFFGKVNKYNTYLSKETNPIARSSDNISIFFTNAMLKYDIMISHLRIIDETISGEKSHAPKVETWSRFQLMKNMWQGVGGFTGLLKTGYATASGLFSQGKGLYGTAKGKTKTIFEAAKGKLAAGDETGLEALNFLGEEEQISILQSLKGKGSNIFKTLKERSKKAGKRAKEGWQYGSEDFGKIYKKTKGKGVLEKLKALRFAALAPTLGVLGGMEGAGADVAGGITKARDLKNQAKSFKEDFIKGAKKEYKKIREKKASEIESVKNVSTKVFEKSGLKFIYDKARVKQEEKEKKKERWHLWKTKKATESIEGNIDTAMKAQKKAAGRLSTWLLLGLGMLRVVAGQILSLPFKAIGGILKMIGGINVLTVAKGIGSVVSFIGKTAWFISTGVLKIAKVIGNINIGSIVSGFTSVLGSLWELLGFILKKLPVIGGVLAIFKSAKDGVKLMSDAASVHDLPEGKKPTLSQRVTALIGGAIGGEKKGWEGAKTGALKGAGIGALVGSAIPIPILGTAIGAVVGAVAGAFLGAVGGKNIAKALQAAWDDVKSILSSAWKFIKLPFQMAGLLAKRVKDYFVDKFKSGTEWASNKINLVMDKLYEWLLPINKWMEQHLGWLVNSMNSLIEWARHPFQKAKDVIKGFFDRLGTSATKNVQAAKEVSKENIKQRKVAAGYTDEYLSKWAQGQELPTLKSYEEKSDKMEKEMQEKEAASAADKAAKLLAQKATEAETGKKKGFLPRAASYVKEKVTRKPDAKKAVEDYTKNISDPIRALLERISIGEGTTTSDVGKQSNPPARSGYDLVLGYGKSLKTKYDKPISQMTIEELLSLQEELLASGGMNSSAVGKFQVVRKTLLPMLAELGITQDQFAKVKFDEDLQNKIGYKLLATRGLEKFKSTPDEAATTRFARGLAAEWASIENIQNPGYNYYGDMIKGNYTSLSELMPTVFRIPSPSSLDPSTNPLYQQYTGKTVATAHSGVSAVVDKGGLMIAVPGMKIYARDKLPTSPTFGDILNKQPNEDQMISSLAQTIGEKHKKVSQDLNAIIDKSAKITSSIASSNSYSPEDGGNIVSDPNEVFSDLMNFSSI